MTIGIYKITNKINNKKYIGQSVNIKRRKYYHFTTHCNMVISNAIFKYGKENFDFEILEECEESQLDELEIKYITEYKSTNREFGYNIDNGGNGTGKMSEETKQKLRELNLGENNAFYGKKHTEESLEKMRVKQSGKKLSDETKQKIKESTTGNKNHFYGKKHTEEVKNKIKEHHKNNPDYAFNGKKHTEESLQKMRDNNKNNDWNNRGKGVLYNNKNGKFNTKFNGKTKSITIEKYPNLGIPLIICTRICMENEIDFKSNLQKEMEDFVQNFNLKTINNII
jgi:group I intron endonuclease